MFYLEFVILDYIQLFLSYKAPEDDSSSFSKQRDVSVTSFWKYEIRPHVFKIHI
jgi:hypothetical protein